MKFLVLFIITLSFTIRAHSQQEKHLEYFLEQGLIKNPLLTDIKNQAASATLDSMRVRAYYKIQINANGNNFYAPVINGWGYDKAISNGAQYTNLVTFSQLIGGRKNVENQIAATQLNQMSNLNAEKISEQDLKLAITMQYIVAYGVQQQILFNNEVLNLLTTESSILKTLTDNGTYRQTDYLTLYVTIQQQKIQIDQLKVQFQNDYALLNNLCGLQDTAYTQLLEPSFELKPVSPIKQTVFFRKFQLDSLRIENSREQLNFNYRPKVNLFADGGFNSTFATTPYKNFGASLGVNFSMIIHDGRQRKIQNSQIQLQQDTRSAYERFFLDQTHQQLSQWYQQLSGVEQLIDQIESQIKYSEGLMDANRKLLITGDVRIADYIIAINNYLNAKYLITQNTINRYQILNQLNYWNR